VTKNSDEELLARINRNRLSKGEPPVSKSAYGHERVSEHADLGAKQAEESHRPGSPASSSTRPASTSKND